MVTEFSSVYLTVGIFACVFMFLIWVMALRINNFGIVDIAWSVAFAPVALYCAAVTHGDPVRRWLIAGMVAAWSLRLGTHIFFRVLKHHPHEDVRYKKLRESWGRNLKSRALIFFEIQGVSIILLSAPWFIACINPRPGLVPLEWAGLVIWVIAVLGESLADWQLKQFRSRPENAGRICEAGLWNYSRHPNYFFEWLVWMAFFVFALGSPHGYLTVYCPALMLFLLLRVTGIPLTEEMSVKSKGAAYVAYQRSTSPFIPWFKKHS